jgi:hypothetical protein
MTTPLYEGPAPRTPIADERRPALTAPLARAVLGAAVLVGITGDALMHDGHATVAFGIWIALIALNTAALLARAGRTASRETLAWLVTAVLFALGLSLRNSETLQGFGVLTVIGCLGMVAVSTRDPRAALFARRLRDTVFAAIDVGIGVVIGILPLAFREALLNEPGQFASSRVRRFIRPAVIVALALLVFGSLLRGADPIFASLTAIPSIDMEVVGSHVLLSGFFAWGIAGWARAALSADAGHRRAAAALPIQLDGADVSAALGTLIVLFAAFIATQLGWLFGGEQFLRARTGLTAATYARQGFFQMVVVVTLVVPVLVGTRAALRPGPELARRHTLLSLPVIILLGAIIASAMLRLKMYVHYYGLTTDRFYPFVFMLWLAVVLLWLAVTVLRDWGRPFIAGTVISGLGTLLLLNIVDPDVIVARVNVARASTLSASGQPGLDLAHLASLSGGGVAVATHAVIASRAPTIPATAPSGDHGNREALEAHVERCLASRMLLARWGTASGPRVRAEKAGAWRSWNWDDALAMDVVSKNSAALLAVQHESCAAVRSPDSSGNSRT